MATSIYTPLHPALESPYISLACDYTTPQRFKEKENRKAYVSPAHKTAESPAQRRPLSTVTDVNTHHRGSLYSGAVRIPKKDKHKETQSDVTPKQKARVKSRYMQPTEAYRNSVVSSSPSAHTPSSEGGRPSRPSTGSAAMNTAPARTPSTPRSSVRTTPTGSKNKATPTRTKSPAICANTPPSAKREGRTPSTHQHSSTPLKTPPSRRQSQTKASATASSPNDVFTRLTAGLPTRHTAPAQPQHSKRPGKSTPTTVSKTSTKVSSGKKSTTQPVKRPGDQTTPRSRSLLRTSSSSSLPTPPQTKEYHGHKHAHNRDEKAELVVDQNLTAESDLTLSSIECAVPPPPPLLTVNRQRAPKQPPHTPSEFFPDEVSVVEGESRSSSPRSLLSVSACFTLASEHLSRPPTADSQSFEDRFNERRLSGRSRTPLSVDIVGSSGSKRTYIDVDLKRELSGSTGSLGTGMFKNNREQDSDSPRPVDTAILRGDSFSVTSVHTAVSAKTASSGLALGGAISPFTHPSSVFSPALKVPKALSVPVRSRSSSVVQLENDDSTVFTLGQDMSAEIVANHDSSGDGDDGDVVETGCLSGSISDALIGSVSSWDIDAAVTTAPGGQLALRCDSDEYIPIYRSESDVISIAPTPMSCISQASALNRGFCEERTPSTCGGRAGAFSPVMETANHVISCTIRDNESATAAEMSSDSALTAEADQAGECSDRLMEPLARCFLQQDDNHDTGNIE